MEGDLVCGTTNSICQIINISLQHSFLSCYPNCIDLEGEDGTLHILQQGFPWVTLKSGREIHHAKTLVSQVFSTGDMENQYS
jgi:hypothetical protein